MGRLAETGCLDRKVRKLMYGCVSVEIERGKYELFVQLDHFNVLLFCLMISGLCLSPHYTYYRGVPTWFRVYSYMLLAITLLLICSNIFVMFRPETIGLVCAKKTTPCFSRKAYLMWSVSCLFIRFCMVKAGQNEKFVKSMVTSLTRLSHAHPGFMTQGSAPLRQCNLIQVMGIAMFFLIQGSVILYIIVQGTTVLYSIWFYILMVENILNLTSFLGGFTAVGVLSFGLLKAAFMHNSSQFRLAIRYDVNKIKLERAIINHDICLEFLEVVKGITKIIYGIWFSTFVPLWIFLGTILVQYGRFVLTWVQMADMTVWLAGSASTTLFGIVCAQEVSTAAYIPLTILSPHLYSTPEVRSLVETFLRRFKGRTIGYTVFSGTPISKGTILMVVNLMTSYVIVGTQISSIQ